MRQLPDEAAELLSKGHVRLEARRFFGRERRHVDPVGNSAEQQEIAHLLRDLNGDIDLRFIGRGTEVGRRNEVGSAEQRRILRRLGLEHVERGTGDLAAIEPVLQRSFVDETTARAVDDPHALFRLREILAAENVACLVGQRRVQSDEIRPLQQLVELDLFDA